MNELETLKGVRDLLSDPARWTKGAFARTGGIIKVPIGPLEQNAACWCLRGAIIKVASGPDDAALNAIGQAMRRVQGAERVHFDPPAIARFNDEPNRRHEEVMKVIDLAIKIEEAKGHGTEA